MKFTCETKALSKACQTVSRAAATRASIPVLEGIKIDVQGDKTSLCGYNLELGILTEIETRGIVEEGSIVLDAKMFCGIAKKLPDFLATIETDDKGITEITSGESKYKIVGMPAKEFPELPQIDKKNDVPILQATLKSMIQQTSFAVADDCTTKPIHTGAFFDVDGNHITTVGTDGYRLAISHDHVNSNEGKFDFVVPKATLIEVSNLLSDNGDKVANISVGPRHALFQIDGYTVFTRLLEGEFIDYKNCIPKSYATEIKVDMHSMLESVERVSLIVNDKLRSPLRMAVNESDTNCIDFLCSTPIGSAHDTLNAKVNGDNLTIGFNWKYLSDALRNADCDEVRLQLNGPLSPMVVLPDDGDSFVFLVLPVKLRVTD